MKSPDAQVRRLAFALSYPHEAFGHAGPELELLCRDIIRRAALGEDVRNEVAGLMAEDELLAEWLAMVEEDPEGRPPHLQPDVVRSYSAVPNAAVVPSIRMVCPIDGERWFRRSIAEKPPRCPWCDGEFQVG